MIFSKFHEVPKSIRLLFYLLSFSLKKRDETDFIIDEKEKLSSSENISIEAWKNMSELKNYYSKAKVFVLLSTNDQWAAFRLDGNAY